MKGRYFLAPIFLCLQFKLYTRVQARKQKPELRINIFHFDQGLRDATKNLVNKTKQYLKSNTMHIYMYTNFLHSYNN